VNVSEEGPIVFITGMLRAGTTFVQKVLNNHPAMKVGYQPNFHRFLELKKDFLKSVGVETQFPLEHRFRDSMYNQSHFEKYVLDFLRESGLEYLIPVVNPDSHITHSGSKEVLCEEFIPSRLELGVDVIHIIRHPFDVIRSMSMGSSKTFVGMSRPLLFDLRNWRKSVAYRILCSDVQGYHPVRYEDLVGDTLGCFDCLFEKLGVLPATGQIIGSLQDDNGGLWEGNSSFSDSVERSEISLPIETRGYISTVCRPEMKWLGYEGERDKDSSVTDLSGYVEINPVERSNLPPDYSSSKLNLDAEARRIEAVSDSTSTWDRQLFFSEKVFKELRSVVMA